MCAAMAKVTPSQKPENAADLEDAADANAGWAEGAAMPMDVEAEVERLVLAPLRQARAAASVPSRRLMRLSRPGSSHMRRTARWSTRGTRHAARDRTRMSVHMSMPMYDCTCHMPMSMSMSMFVHKAYPRCTIGAWMVESSRNKL